MIKIRIACPEVKGRDGSSKINIIRIVRIAVNKIERTGVRFSMVFSLQDYIGCYISEEKNLWLKWQEKNLPDGEMW